MPDMRIISVPQPYASYLVTGAMTHLVVSRPCYAQCPLVIVSDSRRTLPVPRTLPGLYSANVDNRLAGLVNHALGVVHINGTIEPDETQVGVPYMRGRYYLSVVYPKIYAKPFEYRVRSDMKDGPVVFADLWPDEEMISLNAWRERNPSRSEQVLGTPIQASRDGWTGD